MGFEVPPSVFTVSLRSPGVTPGGTTVTTDVSVLDAMGEAMLPNETDCVVAKFFPVIVTGTPMAPDDGSIEVISGFGFSGSLHFNSPRTTMAVKTTAEKLLMRRI
jgi:hypothetical protein